MPVGNVSEEISSAPAGAATIVTNVAVWRSAIVTEPPAPAAQRAATLSEISLIKPLVAIVYVSVPMEKPSPFAISEIVTALPLISTPPTSPPNVTLTPVLLFAVIS